MFRGMISLKSVLLLLLVNFVSRFRLELMYVSLIVTLIPHISGQASSPWFSAACAAAIVHRNYFFLLYQQKKSCESKVKFRQTSNCCKRVHEAAKSGYADKTNESIISQKLGSQDFWQIANSVLKKGKFAILPLFNGLEVLFSTSGKAKLFAKKYSKNSNLDNLDISLAFFLLELI